MTPREPFRFIDANGHEQICAWHPGHDPMHPANKGASHGCCPDCLVLWLSELMPTAQAQA